MTNSALQHAARVIRNGGIVAYPTESVYGLGCDPANRAAVLRLLRLKKRPAHKGLILIAASVSQLQPLLAEPPAAQVLRTWPGPVTWLLAASKEVPVIIRGRHQSVAVRVTDHPEARALCLACGHAIVSTSANVGGQKPARSRREVLARFGKQVDYIVPGRVGNLSRPTRIVDGDTGQLIRS